MSKDDSTRKIQWDRLIKKLSPYTVQKGLRYLKHYGLKEFWIRLHERFEPEEVPYGPWYEAYRPDEETLEKQRKRKFSDGPLISIVVPAYLTPERFLRQMLDSLLAQTYENWELCLANGSPEDPDMQTVLRSYAEMDRRIRYQDLKENLGIAENTNAAFAMAEGDFIALLDHDDLLAPNALYEIAAALEEHPEADVIYTDEDKVTTDLSEHFQPHLKPDFNLDLLRSNNYICHFLVMDADLMKKLAFRPECDGAQDYDLVLRAVSEVLAADGRSGEERILHIPRVLYHWRCHEASTAANPHSKKYAYEAGLRALQDHAAERGIPAKAEETRHVGFYRLKYKEVWEARSDVAAVGGRVLSGKNGKIIGGRMTADGTVFYEGLPKGFGGYLHRAELSQDAEALDLRCIRIRPECKEVFEKIVGVPYTEIRRLPKEQPIFNITTLPEGADIRTLSLQLSEALRQRGRLLYLPEYPEEFKPL